ncbi:DNA-binding transcriptional regulator, AcrR family [Evansella caseinilytica]|uniref:DNA-binding transcriptional regulator, AcrR family n=1 Tax=Evansella caseinilytica TaxID=1503961 RepID=A0A1H3RLL6_9BACI|nr:TetR/AcrR family transcriptional regulator [Evansella caseinilytica]SDZ26493.1 DNA-binding transcriptional regulator, AcrR family [Evansella caseinilytica]
MPKGFTKEEMDIIKEKLLFKGRVMFAKYGFRKFGIRDLTAEIGIASGMFYKFFDSKEELLFIILENEKNKIREKIYNEMMVYKNDPKKALKSFYYIIIKELQENPIMKTILLKEEYPFIAKQMTEEQMLEERNKSLLPIMELANYWKKKGYIKDIDIEVVINSLRSLVYLWFHKAEIGEDNYTDVIEFMINRICRYLD